MSTSLQPFEAAVTHALSLLGQDVSGYGALVVGYSGGVDSTLLLHTLVQLRSKSTLPPILAVHVNHGLNSQADSWQAHCAQQAAALDVRFETAMVNVVAKARTSIEAEARRLRYDVLLSHCQLNSGVLILGQHQDDQLETVLLQLKRGAGPKGLSGMGMLQHRAEVPVLRPWLDIAKADIVKTSEQLQLSWVEDDSNQNPRFDRNFLRQIILPQLHQRWPSIASTASRSARLCAEQVAMLEEVGMCRLQSAIGAAGTLKIVPLLRYSPSWQRYLIRLWIEQRSAPAPSESLTEQMQQILTAREDSEPCIEWAGWQLRRYQQNLHLLPADPAVVPEVVLMRPGQPVHLSWLGVTLTIDPSEQVASEPYPAIELMMGMPSLRIKPQQAKHSKLFKYWLKEWGIPPWERQKIPLLYIDNVATAVILSDKIVKLQGASENWRLNLE
ncbi:tRNA lysidine(34) synthetase TilS [Alteromonas aestuariivivens]|uniref:tRNA(Ile)-lysidine synthase n=1 Tax=Alteromonas aestuariivivens TaxID=1938339 RepID=A0A3D8M3U5_9ALTE|nr:tRNA lysidine(34) synthetase TilS [Alteromonas aestuariivivens]RDV24413.1 tRNA lysidine(34) synthetase TilS [Alteromonas aestuariivivens]